MQKKQERIIIIISVLAIIASLVVIAREVIAEVKIGTGHNLNMQGSNIINIGMVGGVDYEAANKGFVGSAINWGRASSNVYTKDIAWNVAIGVTDPQTNKLRVVGGPIKAEGGLIIQTILSGTQPSTVGSIWMCTDADGQCNGN